MSTRDELRSIGTDLAEARADAALADVMVAQSLVTDPGSQRAAPMSVGMALKLANMTRAQAAEQAWRNAELQIRQADADRQVIEDVRSQRRNRNRSYMLLAGFVLAIVWPLVAKGVLNWPAGLTWTPAIAVVGDLCVTTYAYFRKY